MKGFYKENYGKETKVNIEMVIRKLEGVHWRSYVMGQIELNILHMLPSHRHYKEPRYNIVLTAKTRRTEQSRPKYHCVNYKIVNSGHLMK